MQDTLSPIAYYIGSQVRLTGAPIQLFNLLTPLPMAGNPLLWHPVESTVSEFTLRENGVKVPLELVCGQVVTRG